MTEPDILLMGRLYAPAVEALEKGYTVHKLWGAPDREALLKDVGTRVRAVVTTSMVGFKERDYVRLPNLELLVCFGLGNSAIDIGAAKARGVIVANTPIAIAQSVADMGAGLAITVMRRICETDRFVRAGKWTKTMPPLGRDLTGKLCGIVGLGTIGVEVAKRIEAFGMSICYSGRRKRDNVSYPFFPDLRALAEHVDLLVIACALNDDTRGMIDTSVLEALGPDGFLVNVARGPIVDERALISALQNRTIAGAGLDVYWNEPNVPAELIAMDNVVLAPHIGSSTLEIREQRMKHLLENLRAHFAGEPVPYRLA